MSYKSDREEVDDIRNALTMAITRVGKQGGSKELAEAIEAMIDLKISQALSDLDDKINKRGMYDPDY